MKHKTLVTTLFTLTSLATTASVTQAHSFVRVKVENLSPTGGVSLTPVWVGFHDGSFDSYNPGASAQLGLELLAEDGNTEQITEDFNNNLTYINSNNESETVPSTQVGQRVDGTLGGGPITPGNKASGMFEIIDEDNTNRYFSYASMILPSNDYYIANGDPFIWDLLPLFSREVSSISFNVGLSERVNDGGSEINDFTTSAGNPLYPGLPPGQTGPQQGEDENGVNENVADPYANFLNRPADFDTDFAALDFNDETLYPNGIARITITRVSVPESSTTIGLMGIGGLFLLGASLRRRHSN
ncbi:spondin domain-containing protein [Crocosphaera sp.]|uniref:spondin domain-containing protein n=1 Tax=Crocosphaera sp. TaxID=2729996 RepID=UPI003F212C8C|nr:spondin domain-containing protein [Crocosphaera sp.]